MSSTVVSNLILFGAGASFGSEPAGGPPIGNSLFDALAHFAPQAWGALPAALATAFRQDFEGGMQRLTNEMPHAMGPLQRAMGQYFYRWHPTRESLYVRVAALIRDLQWRGAMATLNYERMLPIACNNAGLAVHIGVPEAANQLELVVPHGMCTLFCESARGAAGLVQYMGNAVKINGEIRCIDEPAAFRQRIEGDAFPPVMSYFEPRKEATAGQAFLESQRARFAELVVAADHIAIIGVQPRVHDEHIWQPLARTTASISYCSGAGASVLYRNWCVQTGRDATRDHVLGGYWRDNFDEVALGAGVGL